MPHCQRNFDQASNSCGGFDLPSVVTAVRNTRQKAAARPGAINGMDADDNNAFHAKQIVMDLDGTISTEVAVLSQGKKDDYDDIVTMGLALSNDGKPVPA